MIPDLKRSLFVRWDVTSFGQTQKMQSSTNFNKTAPCLCMVKDKIQLSEGESWMSHS